MQPKERVFRTKLHVRQPGDVDRDTPEAGVMSAKTIKIARRRFVELGRPVRSRVGWYRNSDPDLSIATLLPLEAG